MSELDIKIKRFADQMRIEMENNSHKENMLEWDDFNHMITELEYHKSKMFIAIRAKDDLAIKEYIADTSNILLAIGNFFNLYDEESQNNGIANELNRNNLICKVNINQQSKNQKLI